MTFLNDEVLDRKYHGYNPEFFERAREKQRINLKSEEKSRRMAESRAAAQKAIAEAIKRKTDIAETMTSIAIRAMKDRGMPEWARSLVLQIAEERQTAPGLIVGPSRSKVVVRVRNEVYYRLRAAKSPINGLSPSYPQIASWFGRDHTGVIFGVARHSLATGAPPITAHNPKRMVERRLACANAHQARKRA